tara:strand:+ start:3063 stop:3542 length:480 start_codon:yes stop_codon:yes gene_type:complete
MFLEVKVRVNGEEKWVDARKFFDYLVKEYSKVSYQGKSVNPYPDRVNKFFDEMPEELIDMWSKAYPNVDIKAECEKARAWLLTNTNKAKKDFKGFTNRWLGRACNNGGQTIIKVDKIYEQQQRQVEYQREMEKSRATDEEREEAIKSIKEMLKKRRQNG